MDKPEGITLWGNTVIHGSDNKLQEHFARLHAEGLMKEFTITAKPELVLTDEELSDHALQHFADLNLQILAAHEQANKEFSLGVAGVFSQTVKHEKPFSHYCIELMTKDINGRLPRGKCRKHEIKQFELIQEGRL